MNPMVEYLVTNVRVNTIYKAFIYNMTESCLTITKISRTPKIQISEPRHKGMSIFRKAVKSVFTGKDELVITWDSGGIRLSTPKFDMQRREGRVFIVKNHFWLKVSSYYVQDTRSRSGRHCYYCQADWNTVKKPSSISNCPTVSVIS